MYLCGRGIDLAVGGHVFVWLGICLGGGGSGFLAESDTTGVKKQELLILRVGQGSFPVFEEVHVARLFSLLCYVFCFVCLRPLCSILPVYLDCPF
jgi:hypothetical protein